MISGKHDPSSGQFNRHKAILESKERSKSYGLEPKSNPAPKTRLSSSQLKQSKDRYHEILTVFKYFGDKVIEYLMGTPVAIYVSDDNCNIIFLFGDQTIKNALEQFGITEGVQFKEHDVGTNSVNLAFDLQKPFQVVGEEHFHETLYQTSCYSAPFQFTNGGVQLSGTIGLMTEAKFHNPFTLPMLANIVESMERELQLRQNSRNQTIVNQLMIHSTHNGVIITDAQGHITDLNGFAETILSRKRDSILGHSVYDLEQVGPYIRQVLETNAAFHDLELTFLNSTDQRITCLFDAMPIFTDRGILTGSYAQFRDISERVLLEKQVILSEKYSAIGKLAAGLAHEIRNPLTSVIGFIHLLRERCKEETELRYLNLVYSELETVKKLVSDLVLMAKPAHPDRKSVHVGSLINDTMRFMESQAILVNCFIVIELGAHDTVIQIDPVQIKQVLINLIQNAIEAMPDGGPVLIKTNIDSQARKLLIEIKDEGIGMTEDEMREILNPFFTTKESGLGLGLSTCYRIVKNHGGELSFHSAKGSGTTFTVHLPLPSVE